MRATTRTVALVVAAGGLLATLPPTSAALAAEAAASPGGASSPEATVEELIASVEASDPLGVLAVLHPAERVLVQTLFDSTAAAAESTGGVDVDALLLALHIDVAAEPLFVEQLADDVAWVTSPVFGMQMELDSVAADVALGPDLSTATVNDVTFTTSPQEEQTGIAVVNVGGSWFVSVAYTAAEIARRDLALPPRFVSGPPPPSAAATPTDAVNALVAAVAAKDPRAVAASLTNYEGGLVADYEATLGAELVENLEAYTVALSADHVQVVGEGPEWAVVEVDAWSFAASAQIPDEFETDGYETFDVALTVNGLCGSFRTYDDGDAEYDESSGCAFAETSGVDVFSILADLGWRGPRFAVVKEDGQWRVSLLQSVLQAAAPLVAEPLSAAALTELIGAGLLDVLPYGFYEGATSLVASNVAPLPVGPTAIANRGYERVAMFRVTGPATFTVENADPNCTVYVLGQGGVDTEWSFDAECGVPYRLVDPEVIVMVTNSMSPFTGNAALGPVAVTVAA